MRAEVGCTRNERAPGDRQVDEARGLAQVSADPERAVMRTHSRTSTLSERRLHVACRRAACGAPTRPDGHRTRRGVTGGPRTHVHVRCGCADHIFSARACAARAASNRVPQGPARRSGFARCALHPVSGCRVIKITICPSALHKASYIDLYTPERFVLTHDHLVAQRPPRTCAVYCSITYS